MRTRLVERAKDGDEVAFSELVDLDGDRCYAIAYRILRDADSGVYNLRQIGDQVWWLGMSGVGGPLVLRGTDWTNVYRGTLSGDTITGTYADVPGGKIQDNGPVVLKLTSTSSGGVSLVRMDPLLSTGFGGTLLTPCTLG